MASPAPDPLADIPPAARAAVAALCDDPAVPVKILVSGGIGTGKSSVLATVRSALRGAGMALLTRPPRDGDDPCAAVVIDDAHLLGDDEPGRPGPCAAGVIDDAALLGDDELGRLLERVGDPGSTVVVATEPLVHRAAL